MSSSKTSDLRSSPEKIRLRYTLENSQIFGDLPADLLTDLVDVMEISVIAGGNALYLQGQESDSLAIVISGRFIAQLDSGSGNKKLLGEMAPGNCIGELGMILQPEEFLSLA
jgi:CRP-like cAMP-binding protein